jgi:nucleotide-binding universal stress UspA family protein
MTSEAQCAREHRIVVGVDGSDPSKAALAWAVGQAKRTGAVVEVVTTWEFPATYGYPMTSLEVSWEDLARQVARAAIVQVAGDTPPVPVICQVLEGNAARVLVKESAGADLLVVGSRGHGGFAQALLGSTGQHCVHHATCPVVIIRDSVTGHGMEKA